MPRRTYFIINLILLLLVLLSMVAGFLYYRWFVRPYRGEAIILCLYSGSSINSLMGDLYRRKLVPNNWLFDHYLRLQMMGKVPKVGEYEWKAGMSLLDLLKRVQTGRVKIHYFAIIPGWTSNQLFERMSREPGFQPERLTPQTVSFALDTPYKKIEGLFFPATYQFYWGSSPMRILHKSYDKMQSILQEEWTTRAFGLPYKQAYQALIVASLIEKESGASEERPLIARVILNRLKKGMRLQIDSTVIYAWGDQELHRVTHRMLDSQSPYNTYRHTGLPPTPICLPERSAIHAALHPADSDALFYVALGDGVHHRFSKTYSQHLGYVEDYRRALSDQKKNILMDFPVTLHQFASHWQRYCQLADYWLPFIASLGTLSNQSNWLLFPVEAYPDCHGFVPEKPKQKRLNHGPKQHKTPALYQHRRN